MATKAKSTSKAIADALTPVFGEMIDEIERPITDPRHLEYLEAVKAYATEHYNDEGMAWDIVVEAMTDREIVRQVWHCRSASGAINKMSRVVRTVGEHHDEIVNA